MATCILKISTARTKLGNSRGKQKNLSHLGSNNLCFKQSHVKLEMCVCIYIQLSSSWKDSEQSCGSGSL